MAARDKQIPLRKIGWAFLLAWVFCVFYTGAAGDLFDGAGQTPFGFNLLYAIAPLAASVAVLLAIILLEPRLGSPTSHPRLVAAAPILTAASTPLMYLSTPDPTLSLIVFCVGAAFTGIGSALLWVMWGEYYAVIPREESELLAPLSAVSAALLVLLVSAMDGWVAIAVASVFPLLSGLCLHLSWTSRESSDEQALIALAHGNEAATGRKFLAGLGRTGFGIFGVFIIVSMAGMLTPKSASGLPLQGILLFSAAMMAIVALMAVSGPRRISLSFLYRWMCPVLVIGFAAVILFGDRGAIIATAASLGGRFTFCLIAQVYFASYAASGKATPAQASSLGWAFVHAGDLVGCIIGLSVVPAIEASAEGTTTLSVLCIVALVCITMLAIGNSSSFLHRAPRNFPMVSASNTDANPNPGCAARSSSTVPSFTELVANQSVEEAPHAAAETEDLNAVVSRLSMEHRLTPRETEVFALLARGRSVPYIRDELIISRETAATHAKHIYAKLGVHSRQELINLVEASVRAPEQLPETKGASAPCSTEAPASLS